MRGPACSRAAGTSADARARRARRHVRRVRSARRDLGGAPSRAEAPARPRQRPARHRPLHRHAGGDALVAGRRLARGSLREPGAHCTRTGAGVRRAHGRRVRSVVRDARASRSACSEPAGDRRCLSERARCRTGSAPGAADPLGACTGCGASGCSPAPGSRQARPRRRSRRGCSFRSSSRRCSCSSRSSCHGFCRVRPPMSTLLTSRCRAARSRCRRS